MTIKVEVEGVGTLEFPDGTTQGVIQQTVSKAVGSKSAPAKTGGSAVSSDTGTPEKKGLLRRTSDKIGAVGEQFQKGLSQQIEGFGELVGVPQVPLPGTEETPAPKGLIEKGARLVGEFAPSPAFAQVPGLEFASKQLSGFLAGKAAPIVKPIAKAAKKSAAFVGEVLSAVPREFFERAINKEVAGKSIFKGAKKSFDYIGKLTQKAINFGIKEAGEEVEDEVEKLATDRIVIEASRLRGFVDNVIAKKQVEGVSLLTKGDLKELNAIKKILTPDKFMKGIKKPRGVTALARTGASSIIDTSKGTALAIPTQRKTGISAAKLNQAKRLIQSKIKFDIQTVKKTSKQGDAALKQIAEVIDEKLVNAVPELGEVNARFERIADLKTRLRVRLKDENVAKNIRNLINKDDFVKQLFFDLDQVAPKRYKFFDALQDTLVRDAFDQLFPGRGGGSGSAAGFANILRLGGVAGSVPAALPLLSPKAQGLAIQGTGLVGRALGRGLKKVAPKAAGLPLKAEIKRRNLFRKKGGD